MRNNTKRVLVIGDAAYPLTTTGFAIVLGQVIPGLIAAGFDVIHFGRGLTKEPKDTLGCKKIYMPPVMDPNGYSYIDEIMEWEHPDLVLMNADPGSLMEFRRSVGVRRVPNLVYTPTEGGPLLKPWSDALREILLMDGRIVTYTRFSKAVIEEGLIDEHGKREKPKREIEVWGHGTDHGPFHQYDAESRAALRAHLGWTDKFVLMNVARNVGRKKWTNLFEAMVELKNRIPNVVLYAHTVPFENFILGGHNLLEERKYFGLDGFVQFHAEMTEGKFGIRYDTQRPDGLRDGVGLIDLYNSADLFVSTSGAEGWNLPLCEAAACGLPVVLPKYSGAWEVAHQWGTPIPVTNYDTHPTGLRYANVNPGDVADVVEGLYRSPIELAARATAGHTAASQMKWQPTVDALVRLARDMTK